MSEYAGGCLASSFLRSKHWAVAEGSGARVALGQNFGKEVENGHARNPSAQKMRVKDRNSPVQPEMFTDL